MSRFRYTLDYENQRLRFEVGAVFGTRVPFDASSRSILLAAGNLRFLLDTGATGFFLFRSEGLDLEVNARAIKRVSTNAGHRIGKSGWLERLDIGDVSLHRVPVTLVPETGLESKADGLLPGTLFDAIYFDHENDFVVLNPTPPSPRAPELGRMPSPRHRCSEWSSMSWLPESNGIATRKPS